jgi:hypothetical protein
MKLLYKTLQNTIIKGESMSIPKDKLNQKCIKICSEANARFCGERDRKKCSLYQKEFMSDWKEGLRKDFEFINRELNRDSFCGCEMVIYKTDYVEMILDKVQTLLDEMVINDLSAEAKKFMARTCKECCIRKDKENKLIVDTMNEMLRAKYLKEKEEAVNRAVWEYYLEVFPESSGETVAELARQARQPIYERAKQALKKYTEEK